MTLTNDQWNYLDRSKRLQYLIDCAFVICTAQTKGKSFHGGMSWNNDESDFESILHKVKHLHCDARSIRDIDVIQFLQNLSIDVFDINQNLNINQQLENTVKQWYKNYFTGLSQYKVLPMPSTRYTIFEFIAKNKIKKIKINKMEYWNKPSLEMMGVDTEYFESIDDVQQNDFFIIGLPLHGNFEILKNLDSFLQECDNKNAKVILDACWYPLLKDKPQINLNHQSVWSVTCTLSKVFPIDAMRSSFRLTPIDQVNPKDMLYSTNKLNSWVLTNLMENFDIDYIVNQYKSKQSKWSKILDLKVSPSVHNCYATKDIYQYDEHKVITQDGIEREKFLSLIYLMENEDLILDNLGSLNDF